MKERLRFEKEYLPRTLFLLLNFFLLTVVLLITLLPLLKILSDSLDGAVRYGFRIFPSKFDLIGYKHILSRNDMTLPFLISCYVTIVGTVLSMLLTTLCGYVLIQEHLPGRKLMTTFIMITMIFNAGLIPTFLVIKSLNLLDNLWVVILPSAISTYNIILMRNFFESVPQSLSESAEIDGCSVFQIFWRIYLPLSTPALATVGLFTMVMYWSEFFPFLYYINNRKLYNFQVILREFVVKGERFATDESSSYVSPDILKNAIIIISIIPVLIVYPFLQKFFVKGINLGAVKE